RRVDRALERGVIVAIGRQAQIRQRILDLGALEKALAAIYAIGQVALDELLLEVARLRVGAVQDGAIARTAAVADMRVDAFDHVTRLVLLVVGRIQRDRLAVVAIGPQIFSQTPAVARDDGVGGLQDSGGGAIILFQPDGPGARKIAQELL